jgi:DNA-binding transcriptional ArsR family regulator
VVDLLRREPQRAGELSEALEMSPPAMSRHLRVLRECGLIEDERSDGDARVRMLRLRHEPFDELRRWVEDVEQFWGGQLAAFKAHAERTRGPGKRRR